METEEVMKILSVNTGSSSIKCALYEMPQEQLLMKGEIERIGQNPALITFESVGIKHNLKRDIADYHQGVEFFLGVLTENETKVLESTDEIGTIGHRVVHGGNKFSKPALIDDDVMSLIKKYAEFASLHGFANITAIESCRKLLPKGRNVAVFDTALYQAITPKAYLYGLPIEMCEKHGIRRYGFHGINHGFVAKEAARIINKPLLELKMITCHLGSGSSITAFKNGSAIDTSMGFTPLEGVLMGTRPGDLDSGILIYILKHLGLNANQLEELLNKDSGLKGLCGKNDMRDIISLTQKGDEKAINALDTFVYRIQKYIGSYIAILGGLDAIVFTAGIGENSPLIRKKILDAFGYLNVRVDEKKNQNNGAVFSTEDSSAYTMTIPANEELAIARETYELLINAL
jgi:acetate kinase